MKRKTEKPFHWNTRLPKSAVGTLNRPTPDKTAEVLFGVVQGQPASDIEERLYRALDKKFGAQHIEFQPSYLGPKNVSDVRPDFAVYGGPTVIIIYADGEFAHGTAADIEHDKLQDARLFAEMQGHIDFPVHIPGRELATAELARVAVDKRW
ncbi:MAG: hypothetical protein LUO93_11140 [Methanomicrobiales archaeon]|nr:hypothetical protein [Methanomicrobiales archaeon]